METKNRMVLTIQTGIPIPGKERIKRISGQVFRTLLQMKEYDSIFIPFGVRKESSVRNGLSTLAKKLKIGITIRNMIENQIEGFRVWNLGRNDFKMRSYIKRHKKTIKNRKINWPLPGH